MNYLPPLRHYKQMVRVVREDSEDHLAKHATSYTLGNAFGGHSHDEFDSLFANDGVSPTELQIRTLDSMNMPSSSARRPGITRHGGIYSTRDTSILFHDLNASTKDYVSGMNGGQVLSRHDIGPGTKFRTELSPGADNKVVYQHEVFNEHSGAHRKKAHKTPDQGLQSHFPAGFDKSKKHRSASHPDADFS